ncbi:MAG: hypothetical protein WDZ49_00035 [Litorilinea sp.]
MFPSHLDAIPPAGVPQATYAPDLSPGATTNPAFAAALPAVARLGAFDQLYIKRPRRGLALVIIAYLIIGVRFAYFTPDWQAPDEPAHYNYITHIAATGRLPVLASGDYNQEYLSLLVDTQFTHKLSIAPLRYENYQPPLYYLLATPVFWATGGNLLALRLFGVAIGLFSIVLLYLCLELAFPGKTLIPLGAAAFAALLPMHVAMLASVNNDGLAGMLLLGALLVLLHWLRDQFYRTDSGASADDHLADAPQPSPLPAYTPTPGARAWYRRRPLLLLLGILLGLGMITKIYAYVVLPIAWLAVFATLWIEPRVGIHAARTQRLQETLRAADWRNAMPALRTTLWIIVPALIIALPMWARNIYLYGGWDFLGLTWHDAVVVGQLRTQDFIETFGWVEYSERAYSFTFKSFWGVFGWMGVFMDERIYTALLIFSGAIFMGILWATVRFISGGSDTDMDFFQLSVLCLLGLILVAVSLSYLWYNLKFVQHQGRYFLWGLLPISVIVALGWREVLQPLQGLITGMLAAVLAGAMLGTGYMTGGPDKWTVLSIGILSLALLIQPLLLMNSLRYTPGWLPTGLATLLQRPAVVWLFQWLRRLVWALPFFLLFLLDLLIPSIFIVPQLTP